MLTLTPISLKDANAFVAQHHRHHRPVTGHKFSIACTEAGRLAGVAIVGRPVSRYLDDGYTPEVNRLCTDGKKRLQFPLCRRVEGSEGDGLSEDRHLNSGHGERGESAGHWLGVRWAGWRQMLDGEPLPQGGLIPGADKIPL